MTLMSKRTSDCARSIVTERQKTSFCHVIYSGGEKICAPPALWHNQKRHRAPGSVKFRTGGHSPRTVSPASSRLAFTARLFTAANHRAPEQADGRTGENPVPTVQSGWKVARAENGRSRPSRKCLRPHRRYNAVEVAFGVSWWYPEGSAEPAHTPEPVHPPRDAPGIDEFCSSPRSRRRCAPRIRNTSTHERKESWTFCGGSSTHRSM